MKEAWLRGVAANPAAPPEVLLRLLAPATLLEAFRAAPRQRAYLRSLPRFPRTGLAHLPPHEDPEVRALAATDPTRSPHTLLTDPDPSVRRAAAANPLIPPHLDEPDLAEDAAANPRLATEQVHELLDQCEVPTL